MINSIDNVECNGKGSNGSSNKSQKHEVFFLYEAQLKIEPALFKSQAALPTTEGNIAAEIYKKSVSEIFIQMGKVSEHFPYSKNLFLSHTDLIHFY